MPASPSQIPDVVPPASAGQGSVEDDAAWVTAIQRGSRADGDEAFRQLMNKYWKVIAVLAWQRVGDRGEAEDIAQETFRKAFCSIRTLQEPVAFLGWILRIARNVALDHLRGRRKALPLEAIAEMGQEVEEASELEQRDEQEKVFRALREIPEPYREVITLRYIHGLDGKTMADLLGEPEGTVRNRLFRALEKLRERLEPGTDRAP